MSKQSDLPADLSHPRDGHGDLIAGVVVGTTLLGMLGAMVWFVLTGAL